MYYISGDFNLGVGHQLFFNDQTKLTANTIIILKEHCGSILWLSLTNLPTSINLCLLLNYQTLCALNIPLLHIAQNFDSGSLMEFNELSI